MAMYIPAAMTLEEMGRRIKEFTPDPRYPHDPYVIIAIEEALAAARDGNFGVGACLVDPSGRRSWSAATTTSFNLIRGATCTPKWTP